MFSDSYSFICLFIKVLAGLEKRAESPNAVHPNQRSVKNMKWIKKQTNEWYDVKGRASPLKRLEVWTAAGPFLAPNYSGCAALCPTRVTIRAKCIQFTKKVKFDWTASCEMFHQNTGF